MDFLAHTNMSPIDILKRLSTYHTKYARLLSITAEELEYAQPSTFSANIDELERESSVKAAKIEIEEQQMRERLLKIRNERNKLNKKAKKNNKILDDLNVDIERLHNLIQIHGADKDDKCDNNDKIKNDDLSNMEEKGIPLDNSVYNSLWAEQQSLIDQIEELKQKLVKIQEKQLDEMKNLALRRLGYM